MERITQRKLERVVSVLNRIVGAPDQPFYRDEEGEFHVNRGTFHIEYTYGRCCLVRDGGSVNVSPSGTKRETYEWIHAFIDGIEYAQANGLFLNRNEGETK